MTIIGGLGGSIAIMKLVIEGTVGLERQEIAKLFCSLIPNSYQEYLFD